MAELQGLPVGDHPLHGKYAYSGANRPPIPNEFVH